MAGNALTRTWRSIFGARQAPEIREAPLQLGPGGPPAGVYTEPTRWTTQTHPGVDADVKRLHGALLAAFDGRPAVLQDYFDDIRDRDDRVDPVCRTRILAIQGRPWSVKPPKGFEDDAEAKRIAERVETIIRRIRVGEGGRYTGGWATCVGNVGDGVLRSYSVNEIEWGVSPEGWKTPKALHWRHPNRFCFDERYCIRLADGRSYTGKLLEEYGPDKFIVHTPIAGRPSYPTRRGVMLSMLTPSLAKRYGVRWWLKAAERFGQPLPYVNLPTGSDHLLDKAKAFLREFSSTWGGVTWGDMKVDVVAGSGQFRGEIYDRLVEIHNTAISIVALGQNLTTEVQGGSFAAARVSDKVRLDLLIGDLGELDGTINAQLVEPLVRYNWPGAPVPVYETEIEERGDFTVEHRKLGICSDNEVRKTLGWGPKADGTGDEYDIVASSPSPDAPPPALPPGDDAPPALPPPGGADDDEDPFELSRAKPASSPTSAATTTTPERALYEALVASRRTSSRAS